MYEIVHPNQYPHTNRLVDLYKNDKITLAIQLDTPLKDVIHSNIFNLPFDWHIAQVKLLQQQTINGRQFINTHKERQNHVSYINNATLLGGLVIDSNSQINRDTAYHSWGREIDTDHFLSKNKRVINEAVFYLGEIKEYFHWILDCLSAIYLWKKFGLNRETKIFVANITDFKIETLRIYGIPKEMIAGDKEGHVSFKHIFIPSTLGGGQAWSTPLYLPDFHRHSTAYITPEKSRKKYYISRSKTPRRHLNNEKQVEQLLVNNGFEIIHLEEYSFKEQISLMKSASIIVAPHGAGLTNIVYCLPKTIIIELFCEKYLNCCFYKLSSLCDHIYIPLISSSCHKPKKEVDNFRWAISMNWDVDILQLKQLIEHTIKFIDQ